MDKIIREASLCSATVDCKPLLALILRNCTVHLLDAFAFILKIVTCSEL